MFQKFQFPCATQASWADRAGQVGDQPWGQGCQQTTRVSPTFFVGNSFKKAVILPLLPGGGVDPRSVDLHRFFQFVGHVAVPVFLVSNSMCLHVVWCFSVFESLPSFEFPIINPELHKKHMLRTCVCLNSYLDWKCLKLVTSTFEVSYFWGCRDCQVAKISPFAGSFRTCDP